MACWLLPPIIRTRLKLVTQVTHISYMAFSFPHDISMPRQMSNSKEVKRWRQANKAFRLVIRSNTRQFPISQAEFCHMRLWDSADS